MTATIEGAVAHYAANPVEPVAEESERRRNGHGIAMAKEIL
jgi:hypothetical protein